MQDAETFAVDLTKLIGRVAAGHQLSADDAEAAFVEVMEGRASPVQLAALLVAVPVPATAEPNAEWLKMPRGISPRRKKIWAPVKPERIEGSSSASYSFLVDGEILYKGELFEHFRYRFTLPEGEVATEKIPVVFQRYLRPGSYTLVLDGSGAATLRP